MDKRPSWCEYFLNIAEEVAKRATCDRKHVGAVLVKDKQILATGYNGSVKGMEHCDDVGHLMEDGHCVRTVHAETNALAQAAKSGISVDGATIYINTFPCWNCFKLLANAGIAKVSYRDNYRNDDKIKTVADRLGIIIFHHNKANEPS